MTHKLPSSSLRCLTASAAFRGAVLLTASALPLGSAWAQQPLLVEPTRVPWHMVAAGAELPPTPPTPPAPQNNAGNGSSIHDDLFAGTEKFAKGATDATEVNMDPDSLNLVNGANAGRARKTILNVVRTYSYDKPGMYNPSDVEEYRRKLETGDWHCSVRSRDLKSGESTDICSRRRAPDMVETAIITVEPKELTFIHTIRRADGQGGRVNGMDVDLDGVSEVSPLGATMLAARSRMEASMATMQARMAAQAAQMRVAMVPSMAALQANLQRLQPTPVLPEQKER